MEEHVEPCVWLLVVKGNLRHRIVKLGCERPIEELSDEQRKLRLVAEFQKFDSAPPERPPWANGAFLYLEHGHAQMIQDVVQQYGLKLQSKHMLVSQKYISLVEQTLQQGPEGSGREAFLMRRAGSIEKKEKMPSLTDGPVVLLRGKEQLFQDRLSRLAAGGGTPAHDAWLELQKTIVGDSGDGEYYKPSWANGAQVYLQAAHVEYVQYAVELHNIKLGNGDVLVSRDCRCLFERAIGLDAEKDGVSGEVFLAERSLVIESETDLRDIIGVPRRNFLMIRLDDGIMEEKDIDLELAEFLTSPPSAQCLDQEMWRNAWQHVCKENAWLEMQDSGGDDGSCAWCTLCLKWADLHHIKSDECRSRRESKEYYLGPLLDAILRASSPTSQEPQDDPSSGSTEQVKQQ